VSGTLSRLPRALCTCPCSLSRCPLHFTRTCPCLNHAARLTSTAQHCPTSHLPSVAAAHVWLAVASQDSPTVTSNL
jgi:hypothetical protein